MQLGSHEVANKRGKEQGSWLTWHLLSGMPAKDEDVWLGFMSAEVRGQDLILCSPQLHSLEGILSNRGLIPT